MGWLFGGSKDYREERIEANKTNKEWQEELDNRGLTSKQRAEEMNKNYQAHIGKKATEIGKERNSEDDPRASFTKEELNRENRLEKKQVDNIKDTSSKKETKSELEETRKDKKSWW